MENTNRKLIPSLVANDTELQQILSLQQENLLTNLSAGEQKDQGFVTLRHTLPLLQQMHQLAPSVIVKEGDRLAGYALTMAPDCRRLVPGLEPMYSLLDTLSYNGEPVSSLSYYVMGQVCVDKDYRGQGVFQLLYDFHREAYSHTYDALITEIATRNHRSLRAHEKVGFKIIHTHRDELDEWAVVIWDWR
ncbi:MAG: GNAT family N-acetyltransferase [Citrobacter freundii]|nr:MAG: GNAT family N-acetyltransferase [Citrobacter freundii]